MISTQIQKLTNNQIQLSERSQRQYLVAVFEEMLFELRNQLEFSYDSPADPTNIKPINRLKDIS